MKAFKSDILPKQGFGEIMFGETSEKVIKLLGQPEDVENIEDVDGFNTVVLYYYEKGITIFFEGKEKSVVACVETENPEATMYGKRIFEMTEKDIVALMKEKGFEVAETEMETTGERRVSYDDAMIDFFFLDGDLVVVNWGVLVNEKGEIEEI
ncbi:MAG TPA: hypothetical protein PKM34_05810 [Bacteroidales bacterium]|nr:hypothetical protein [Bacteroidales bacterium]HPM93680.1 hypothetical protein [Bacteroidales bacterium]